MSNIKGERGIGLAKGTTWGTAVQPGTGHGVYLQRFSPPAGNRALTTNGDEFDHDMPTLILPGDYPEQTGSMGGRLYFEGIERILASLFGVYVVGTPPESGVVRHEFTFKPIIGSIFHALAWDEGDEVKSVPSMKIKSGKISYSEGFQFDVNFGGDRVTIQSWSEPLLLTYPSDGKGVWRLLNTTVSINAQAGADFSAGDVIHVNKLELGVDLKYKTLPITSGYEGISEHRRGDEHPDFIVDIAFPEKDTTNAAFLASFDSATKYKMRIKMESAAVISGKATKYTFEVNLPGLYLPEPPVYAMESPIPVSMKLATYRVASNPTGMSNVLPYAYMLNEIPALTGYPAS
jgi:hypothetical protein